MSSPESRNQDLSKEKASILDEYQLFVMSLDAGTGHDRFGTHLAKGFHAYAPGYTLDTITIPDLTAEAVHFIGSGGILRRGTELVQSKAAIQTLIGGLHRRVLNRDLETVKLALFKEISQSSKERIILSTLHPDAGYYAGELKDELSVTTGKEIKLMVTMTDHLPYRPQFVWSIVKADIIVVPDKGSREIIDKDLKKWAVWYRGQGKLANLPKIIVNPYPVDLDLINDNFPTIDRNFYQEKKDALDPAISRVPRLTFAPGGSAPHGELIGQIINNLSQKDSTFAIQILGKQSRRADHLRALSNGLTKVYLARDNKASIRQFSQFMYGGTDILITKPSEQVANFQIPIDAPGGAIMLLLKGVGDQEEQNRLWLAEHGLIPSDQKSQDWVLKQALTQKKFVREIYRWRGLYLPEDPSSAASLIELLYQGKVFSAMLQAKHPMDHPDLATDGAVEYWQQLYATLADL